MLEPVFRSPEMPILGAVLALSTLATIVFLVGVLLHIFRGERPGERWSFTLMVCSALMAAGNLLGFLSGSIINGLCMALMAYVAYQYYRLWQAQRKGF